MALEKMDCLVFFNEGLSETIQQQVFPGNEPASRCKTGLLGNVKKLILEVAHDEVMEIEKGLKFMVYWHY